MASSLTVLKAAVPSQKVAVPPGTPAPGELALAIAVNVTAWPKTEGPATDRAVYGSAPVGMLGAIVRPTNVQRILQLDCLATDFFHAEAFPTFLYFNPYTEPREVYLDAGSQARDVYDAAAHRFVLTAAKGKTRLTIPGDSAVVAVLVAAGRVRTRDGHQLRCDGAVIDFRCQ